VIEFGNKASKSGRFNFRNFTPPESVIFYGKVVLSNLLELAPVDSGLIGTVSKVGEKFVCHVDLFFEDAHLVSDCESSDPMEAIQVSNHQLNAKLTKKLN